MITNEVGAREIGVVGEADACVALFVGAAAAPAKPDRPAGGVLDGGIELPGKTVYLSFDGMC